MAQTAPAARTSTTAFLLFHILFLIIVYGSHVQVFMLPFFWDELGQFIPASLDLHREGALIAKSTLPNVHPPGLMFYLSMIWDLTGFSVPATRSAMLSLATIGAVGTFALAIRLCRPLDGLPGFTAAILLVVSPLFYTQSFMAQLDMPAMVFSIFALLLFLDERYVACTLFCTAAVMMKETAITTPAVFGAWLLWRKRANDAVLFLIPAVALAAWLIYLKMSTGHLFGNAEFTHYNVGFQLHPVRLGLTLVRRIFYLFVDNFHWIGTIAIFLAWRRTHIFRTSEWLLVALVFAAQTLAVTVLGGAALERYLMPVLPLFYIATAAALTTFGKRTRRAALGVMIAGLITFIFVPAPFPYPYENSYAVVDFVQLHQQAAQILETQYPTATVASAWPFPDALRRPDFGYVKQPMKVKGLNNFDRDTVLKLKDDPADVLVIYSRTWEPTWGALRLNLTRRFLSKYYLYQPQIKRAEIEAELGLTLTHRFESRGQWIEIYVRESVPNMLVL